MKRYYPLLSIAVAIALLVLPIALLGRTSVNDRESSASVDQRELSALKEKINEVSSQVVELRMALASLGKNETPSAAQPTTPKQDAIQSKLEQVQKQLEALLAQKSPQEAPKRVEPNEAPAVQEGKDLEPPVAKIAAGPAAKDPAPAEDPEATAPQPAPADPEMKAEQKVLTPEQLAAAAKVNLQNRVATTKEPPKSGEPPVAVPSAPLDDQQLAGLLNPDDAVPKKLFDMVMHRPQEGVTVNRTEQLYAYTETPGWPVVLVRSNHDNEEWWAQQVVGRRGNLIGAHVNFGSGKTPRGSAFKLVILLLDSEEEAVRFRTARRFNELPPGIRRSREFVYILR